MKILVIGHSVEDHIHMGKNVSVRPGGIFYSAAAFVNYMKSDDEIFLCTEVSQKKSGLFSPVYDRLNLIYTLYTGKISSVHLIIKEKGEREEFYESISGNLKIPADDHYNFDGILLNMISGYDILPGQLEDLRRNFQGLIYLDVHTLSRGTEYVERNRIKRDFRIIPDFRKWAANADIVQVNKPELRTLFAKETEEEIISEAMKCGIRHLIVTLEEEGAVLYSQCEDNQGDYTAGNNFFILHEKVKKVRNENKVGCGDVFGAVFFYNYIKHRKAEIALKAANRAAGTAAGFKDLEDFKKLRDEFFE